MILGLTGPNAAGKGEAARLLSENGYAIHSLSDVLREQARQCGLDLGRETLIRLGQELRRAEGPGVLARRILPRLSDPAVVDSVRAPAEVEVLRTLHGFRLLGIDAPLEVRWQRAVARGREGDIPDLQTFQERELRENGRSPDSQQLGATLALADAVVVNNGDLEEFRIQILTVVDAWEALFRQPPSPPPGQD